ncbi:MAG: [Firmicutes bacterium]|nr:[citrate (pro-3S)-lyase] ligase [Bacillota bacterium]
MAYTLSEISKTDTRSQKKMDALLKKEGIQRDGNLDYSCGIFDDDWNLIATGSCFGNTLRCMAVDSAHQGEGLMNQVLSHLVELQYGRGNSELFLYTKPQTAKFFRDLGFYEIARTGTAVFTENRRNGFSRWLDSLGSSSAEGTSAAIVMNANPFTKGHRSLVEQAAAENSLVHLFVLSEDAGPIPASVRLKLVEEAVKDLKNVVIHQSGPYMISSATFPSYFLKDADAAITAHAELDLAVFAAIAERLGISSRYVGEEPFSHVTSLYNRIMQEKLPEKGIACRVVPRLESDGKPISASSVRQAIKEDRMEDLAAMLPESSLSFFLSDEAAPVIEAIRREKDVIHY